MGGGVTKKGENCLMGETRSKDELSANEFSDIVKRAYDRGLSDQAMTVQQLLADLKNDLLKLKFTNI